MKILVTPTASGGKIVNQVGEFRVNNNYLLTGGYHSGKMLRLTYISYHKQVIIDGNRERQISGELLGEEMPIRVNAVLSHLQKVN